MWDSRGARLLWVDVLAGTVNTGRIARGDTLELEHSAGFPHPVSAVAPGPEGSRLIAAPTELLVVNRAGVPTESVPVPVAGSSRLNDGKVDPAGRFLVGSLAVGGASTHERLYAITREREVSILDDDISLSNGLGWSVDGRTMYSVDSGRRVVYVRGYGPAGARNDRRVLIRFDAGVPDGLAIDMSDHLWIAMWDLGEVRRYRPDGVLVGVVEVPAPLTSSVAFAGPDLSILVITSARDGLTAGELAEHPESGRMFAVRPGVLGKPETRWGGFSV